MPDEKVTKEQILEVLKKNGIHSIDDLADQLANGETSANGEIAKFDNIGELASSWVIKVWKLDSAPKDFEQIKNLPDKFGGDILKSNNGL
ncbi:MAG: hypothetical protein IPI50_12875 [Saprospiraceae bacterium]|nr:hypothetical protein [Saprospiraceae bacterium]